MRELQISEIESVSGGDRRLDKVVVRGRKDSYGSDFGNLNIAAGGFAGAEPSFDRWNEERVLEKVTVTAPDPDREDADGESAHEWAMQEGTNQLLDGLTSGAYTTGQTAADGINSLLGRDGDRYIFRDEIAAVFGQGLPDEIVDQYLGSDSTVSLQHDWPDDVTVWETR